MEIERDRGFVLLVLFFERRFTLLLRKLLRFYILVIPVLDNAKERYKLPPCRKTAKPKN